VKNARSEGAEAATINRELSLLKRAFRLNYSSDKPGRLTRMPKFPAIKERNIRKGFIDDEQYARLTQQISDGWLRLFVEIAYTYGMRRGEIANLRVSQVDLVRRTIRLEVGETKNDDGRQVVMTPVIYELVREAIIGKKPDDLLITRENGQPVGNFRKRWRKLTAAAEIPNIIVHDFRRSAVSNLVNAGVPEQVAMLVSGHRTRAVFDRYFIANSKRTEMAIRRLEEARAENGHNFGHNSPETDARPKQQVN